VACAVGAAASAAPMATMAMSGRGACGNVTTASA
jgi:hypothetical protein